MVWPSRGEHVLHANVGAAAVNSSQSWSPSGPKRREMGVSDGRTDGGGGCDDESPVTSPNVLLALTPEFGPRAWKATRMLVTTPVRSSGDTTLTRGTHSRNGSWRRAVRAVEANEGARRRSSPRRIWATYIGETVDDCF
jgi:hypothetical protein